MYVMYDLTPVTELVNQLRAHGIEADLDIASIAPPGVWVAIAPMSKHTLTARRYDLRLYLVHGDTEALNAMTGLVELANRVDAALPQGVRSAEPVTVTIPAGTSLPALQVPYTVFSTPA